MSELLSFTVTPDLLVDVRNAESQFDLVIYLIEVTICSSRSCGVVKNWSLKETHCTICASVYNSLYIHMVFRRLQQNRFVNMKKYPSFWNQIKPLVMDG